MIIAHAAVLAALVASSGIMMAQHAPMHPGVRRPAICTEQYAPVCGRIGTNQETYSNQCYARAAGADVIAQGPCISSVVRPQTKWGARP
jgi:Kazal-type serine protease inhibitor domain